MAAVLAAADTVVAGDTAAVPAAAAVVGTAGIADKHSTAVAVAVAEVLALAVQEVDTDYTWFFLRLVLGDKTTRLLFPRFCSVMSLVAE